MPDPSALHRPHRPAAPNASAPAPASLMPAGAAARLAWSLVLSLLVWATIAWAVQ